MPAPAMHGASGKYQASAGTVIGIFPLSNARPSPSFSTGFAPAHERMAWVDSRTGIQPVVCRHLLLDRYAKRNENFVLVVAVSSGCFQPDLIHEFVEIVDDALIEPIELGTLLLLQFRVSRERPQQAGRKGRVDPLEQLQEHQADRIAAAQQAIAAATRYSLHEPLGPKLGKVVAE